MMSVKRIAITLVALMALPAGASAATKWLPPSVTAPQARSTGAPSVAGNDDGRVVAAWATPTGVVATLRTPGGPWYAPVRVPGSGPAATQVSTAMTTGGLATVAWVHRGRVRVSVRPARQRFLPAVTVSGARRVASTPVMAFGGPCAPLIVWSEQATSGGASTIMSACASAAGAFATARPVSATGDNAFTPTVAASRGGTVVAWRSDAADQYHVRAALRQRDGSFTVRGDVSQASANVFVDPAVTITPTGDATAVWTLSRGADLIAQSATLPAGGTWGRVDDLSRVGGHARGAQVATDASGNAVAVWVRNGVVQATTRVVGQPWAPPRDLSDASITAGGPRLSVSASGAALVTWPAVTGTTAIAQATLRSAGGDFGAPTTISNPRFPALAPQGAIGDDGIAPVAWQWADPTLEPLLTPAGVASATGFAGSDQPGPAIVVDLRARPSSVRPGQRILVTFGLSGPSRVRLVITPASGGAVKGALSVSGADGANAIAFEGGVGGASLGRGRWRLRATPTGGLSRSLVLVVR